MSDQDLTFRCIVLGLFIGARYVRWHARHLIGWRASQPGMTRHKFDTTLLIALSIAWLAAVVVYVAVPQIVVKFAAPMPTAVRWCGVAAPLAGLALLYYSDRCLGENLSVTLRIREGHTLVTSGPYRYVRHPIYTATLFYAAAMGVITANYLLAAAFFLPMLTLIIERLPREEQMMLDAFGDEYRTYMRRTGRLLPRIRQGDQA